MAAGCCAQGLTTHPLELVATNTRLSKANLPAAAVASRTAACRQPISPTTPTTVPYPIVTVKWPYAAAPAGLP